MSLFALSSSVTFSVYKYFVHRILNLVTDVFAVRPLIVLTCGRNGGRARSERQHTRARGGTRDITRAHGP